jgi:endonuclease YncB( thermonuclease family)
MAHRILLFLLLLCVALSAEATMVRVIEIVDGRTLLIERDGNRERIQLAGIEITNEVHARALLQWTIAGTWVMLEPHEKAFFVYRSPDALFVNRELVQRGFARALRTDIDPQPSAMVTYLGIVQPSDAKPAEKTAARSSRSSRSATATQTSSGTRRRSPTSRSRSAPKATPTSAAADHPPE